MSDTRVRQPAYRKGDRVEVRPLPEILASLDQDGKLDGVPFMPEMAPFCGRQFTVTRRAEKTCVEGLGVRRMENAVMLDELRCDGSAHDGCQRNCLIFWKDAWLKPATAGATANLPILDAASVASLQTRKGDDFFCQSTELLTATTEFPPRRIGHYFRDLALGEITLPRLLRVFWRAGANKVLRLLGRAQLYGHMLGTQVKPAKGDLNLQPGEWVEVKSRGEILATLDENGKNRGLSFEIEMQEHCGRRYQVAFPVTKIILEEPGMKLTNKMVNLDCTVVLEGVVCQGLCAKNCSRANLFYWRESWLRRIEAPKAATPEAPAESLYSECAVG